MTWEGCFGEDVLAWDDHPSVNGDVGVCRCGGPVVWDQPDGVSVHRPDLHRDGCEHRPAPLDAFEAIDELLGKSLIQFINCGTVGPSCSRHGGRHPVGQVEQLALLWLPGDEAADQAPDWLTGGETPAQRTNAIRGLHPTGRALGRGTNRCTACRHRVKFDGYSKCALDQHRWTNARGTDIRARWRECSEWMEA